MGRMRSEALEVVEALLKNKADPNAMDGIGRTPLHWAAARGHLEVVEALLKNKADRMPRTGSAARPYNSLPQRVKSRSLSFCSRTRITRPT